MIVVIVYLCFCAGLLIKPNALDIVDNIAYYLTTLFVASLFVPLIYWLARLALLNFTDYFIKGNPEFLKLRKMVFKDDSWIVSSPEVTTTKYYKEINKIIDTKDYLFLLLNQNQATLLPKKYFTPDQIKFITEKII